MNKETAKAARMGQSQLLKMKANHKNKPTSSPEEDWQHVVEILE